MIKLQNIASFITVVEENSFAAAARKQGISVAAVSRQIGQLESQLNTQLLRRTTRKITLTEIGAQYYQHCKNALRELADAQMSIAGSQSEATGMLNVMSNRYFAIRYILPKLSEFMALNPKLQIKLELAERFPNLAEEGIDLAFGIAIGGTPDLVRRRVAITRYVFCASPEYLAKYGTPKTPADLRQHRYITHSMRRPENVLSFRNHEDVQIEPILFLNDSKAMRECAIRGMGIIKLHDYKVIDAIAEGSLIEILHGYQEPQQPVYLYYQKTRYLQPKIRRFIDFYIAELNNGCK